MKTNRLVSFTVAFGIAAAASLAAQAGGQSDRADSTARTITMTGCLQHADRATAVPGTRSRGVPTT